MYGFLSRVPRDRATRESLSQNNSATTQRSSSTAEENAASFAFEGVLKPLSFVTNCSDAAWISSSVTGGSKLNSVLMFLHMPVHHRLRSAGVLQSKHRIVKSGCLVEIINVEVYEEIHDVSSGVAQV